MHIWATIALWATAGCVFFGAGVGGAGRSNSTPRDDIDDRVDAFEAAAEARGWDGSDPDRAAPVVAKVRHVLKGVDEPEKLPPLLHAWRKQFDHLYGQVPDDRLEILDSVVTTEIVDSLAERRTPEAARILVELMCDETLGWDGEYGLLMYEAVLHMGRICIPFLETVPGDNASFREAQFLLGELRRPVPAEED